MINKTGLYVSPLLTNISLAYRNDNYIAERIMPVVKVKKDSGQITTYGMDNLRVTNTIRAQGANTNEVSHTASIGSHYFLIEHALKELVSKEEMENADAPIKPKIDAVQNLLDRIWAGKEKGLADTMGDTSVMTNNTTLAGNDQWSDYSNSDPIGDMVTGAEAVRQNTGKKPNTLIFSYDVWMKLLQHPDMVARIKVGNADSKAMMQMIMTFLPHIKDIIIGDANYNSAVEGATDTLADIWTKNAWIGYIEKTPTLKSRSFGFTYQGKEHRLVDELPMSRGGEAWDRKGDFVRVTDKYDQQIVDVNCMYLFKSAIA